jgi:hypothetical protein
LSNSHSSEEQHCFYYSGVGTYGNKIQQIFNAAFAPNNLDVRRIVKTAGEDINGNYKTGDNIFIFGFSRGAAIARRFASIINKYIPVGPNLKFPVRFLAVFDTVASIGFPNLDDDQKPVSDVVFENGVISKYVQEALHLVSLDEKRIAFQPTLMNKDKRVSEIWFPGAHADVGGGFWYDGLSDISLEFMIEELKKRKLGLNILEADKVNYNNLKSPNEDYKIDLDDVFIKPNHRGKAHPKDRWGPFAKATLSARDVRVDTNSPDAKRKPFIHHSVVNRITDVIEYRPKALKGVDHTVIYPENKQNDYKGIVDHIAI